jgi:hypothetical protein
MKLTPKQMEALTRLAKEREPKGSYSLQAGLNTLNSLALKKLVSATYGPGSISMPHTSIKWKITEAGRAALAEHA